MNPLLLDLTCACANAVEATGQSWWDKLWSDPVGTFTGALFLATAALIATGLIQWLETRNTAKRQLRAYVAVEKIDYSTVGGGYEQPTLFIRNFGATPAQNMQVWTNGARPLQDPNRQMTYGDGPISNGQMLHPQQAIELPANLLIFTSRMSEDYLIWGRVIYQDIYGRWWVTKFASTHNGFQGFEIADDHNLEIGPFKSRAQALGNPP